MYFNDIQDTTKDEKVRAWAVEQAIDHSREHRFVLKNGEDPSEKLLKLAVSIEEYVKSGKTGDTNAR